MCLCGHVLLSGICSHSYPGAHTCVHTEPTAVFWLRPLCRCPAVPAGAPPSPPPYLPTASRLCSEGPEWCIRLCADVKRPDLLRVPSRGPGSCEAPVHRAVPRPPCTPQWSSKSHATSSKDATTSPFLPIRTTQEAAGLGWLCSSASYSHDIRFLWARSTTRHTWLHSNNQASAVSPHRASHGHCSGDKEAGENPRLLRLPAGDSPA